MADVNEGMTKKCPHCGSTIPIHFGFRIWCETCGWNIEDAKYQLPMGVFERMWRWQGKRSGDRILQQALRFSDYRPRVTASIVLSYLLALLVHGFTLYLVYLAVWLVLSYPLSWDISSRFLTIARFLGAGVLLLFVWKVRPRLAIMPKDVIRREQAPTLFQLMDRVAECLHAPQVVALSLGANHNASFGRMGMRGESVLSLGLPLMFALDRQELVAVIAHELAHSVNGDPERTWLVHSAIGSLVEWHDLFRIDAPILHEEGFIYLPRVLFLIILRLLSVFFWLAAVLLAILLYAEMQLAEYRSDGLGAQIGGTTATKNALRKQYLGEAYGNILEKARFYPETRILGEIRERLACVPESEFKRIDRLIEKGEAQLGTHPPTRHRIQFLQSRPTEVGQISLTSAEHAKIVEELSGRFEAIEQQVRKALPTPN